MAYTYAANVAVTTSTSLASFLQQLLEGAGWTVYDTYSTYRVLRSDGETPTGKYMYIKINDAVTTPEWGSNWNSSTHAWVGGGASLTAHSPVSASRAYGYADKDGFFVFITNDGSTIFATLLLAMPQARDGAFTTTITGAVNAGSNVVVPVADNSLFEVGGLYCAVDLVNFKRQPFTCTAKGTGTITMNTVSTSLASGSLVGVNVYPVMWQYSTSTYLVSQHPSLTGGVIAGNAAYVASLSQFNLGTTLPGYQFSVADAVGDSVGPVAPSKALVPCKPVEYTTSGLVMANRLGTISTVMTTPAITSTIIGQPATLNNFDVVGINSLATGTSSSANTSTTLNDTSKSWTVDQWAGKALVITSGTATGQAAKIISNTATQLVVSSMAAIPGADTYAICDSAYRGFVFNSANIFLREGV